jgi:hypothetical protein
VNLSPLPLPIIKRRYNYREFAGLKRQQNWFATNRAAWLSANANLNWLYPFA